MKNMVVDRYLNCQKQKKEITEFYNILIEKLPYYVKIVIIVKNVLSTCTNTLTYDIFRFSNAVN